MLQWIHSISTGIARLTSNLLNEPRKVLVLCLSALFVTLVLEGSLFRLWSLKTDEREIIQRIADIQQSSKDLQMKIERIDNPKLLELEARDRFDLVREGDLVFIFSDLQGEDGEGS